MGISWWLLTLYSPPFSSTKSFSQIRSSHLKQVDDQESIVMPNNCGEKFLCFLPKVEKSKSGKLLSQHNISSMVMESETRNKVKTPGELLEVLKKDKCFARQEGWWSYEFCHQNKIRQLHIDGDKVAIFSTSNHLAFGDIFFG